VIFKLSSDFQAFWGAAKQESHADTGLF